MRVGVPGATRGSCGRDNTRNANPPTHSLETQLYTFSVLFTC